MAPRRSNVATPDPQTSSNTKQILQPKTKQKSGKWNQFLIKTASQSHYLPKNGIFFAVPPSTPCMYVCMYVIGSAYASVDAPILQSGDKLALQISNSTTTTKTRTQSIRPPSSFLLEKTLHQRPGICGAGCFERGERRRSGRHSRLILKWGIKAHANYGGRVLGGTGRKYARTERAGGVAGGVSYDAFCCRCVWD